MPRKIVPIKRKPKRQVAFNVFLSVFVLFAVLHSAYVLHRQEKQDVQFQNYLKTHKAK
jgi:hypothetical protein